VSSSSTIDVGNNLSNHLSLETCLILNSTPKYHSNDNKVSNTAHQLRWDKSDLRLYDKYTYQYLEAIGLGYAHQFSNCTPYCSCGRLGLIDDYHEKIVNALTAGDAICVPSRKVGFFTYWWDVE